MTLLLGPQGAGKTLLSKRLHTCSARGSFTNIDEPPATIPTVGTNLVNVTVCRKQEVTIREIGGCMGPIWSKYYSNCSAILYMIDVSNRHQVSASCIQLLDVLSDKVVSDIPVLIILNKIDTSNRMKKCEFESLLRMDNILKCSDQRVTVVEVSARDGTGLAQVLSWIQDNCKIPS